MNVIVVHGSNPKDELREKDKNLPPKNERDLFPWIRRELEKNKVKVNIPLLPKSWNPSYEDWKKEIENLEINEETILVGFSGGSAFCVRWLGESGRKIKKLILVASVTGKEECNKWLRKLGDFEISPEIKDNVDERIIFVSDNDKPERLESARLYENKLDAKLIELPGRGHFMAKEIGGEFPELLEEILK